MIGLKCIQIKVIFYVTGAFTSWKFAGISEEISWVGLYNVVCVIITWTTKHLNIWFDL